MKNYFTFAELCIINDPLPLDVADKLLKHHILPMNKVREALGKPITASQRSGYRPKNYEIRKGRSGNSQHTFEGLGAVDWTAADVHALLQLILANTPYERVCYYPNNGFIHCDHRHSADRKPGFKRYYECPSPAGQWRFIKYINNK